MQKHSVNTALILLKNDKQLKNAGIAFYAVDLKTGETIAEHNSNLALAPASTQKLVSSATALETLGKYYRFETKLEYSGTIDTATNILHGNIIIRGGGDPTLGSRFFGSTKNHKFMKDWAKAIKEAGIDSITGSIVGDARIYTGDIVPATWSWEDMGNYFGAGACGLSVFDNTYSITYKTGSKKGAPTEILDISPKIPGMTFDNKVISAKVYSDRSYIFGAPYQLNRTIRGKLPLNQKEYIVKGSMPDPAYFAAYAFEQHLKNDSLKIGAPATTFRLSPDLEIADTIKSVLLHTTKSPTLQSIAEQTNLRSINLFAEHLLVQPCYSKTKRGSVPDATLFTKSFWANRGMDTKGMSINDGSGLSRYNTVTAKQMVFLLKYMNKKSKNYEVFYNTMPIAGKKGTIRSMCKGTLAANNLRAKSGSIRGVRAYAGYVTSKSGRKIAFSMMLNNYGCSSSQSSKKLEKLMIAMANFNK